MYTTDFLGFILASALYISLASATISLGQFQTVTGFPSACQNAYNAPIAGCDASDFPQNCSSECFYALTQAESLIDNACVGQQAPFNSIIGQMFEGNGPDFMCTSEFSLESSGGTSSTSYYTDATSFPPSTTAASTSSKSTSRVSVTTTTESSSSSQSKSESKSKTTTSSTVPRTSTDAELTSSATSPSSSTSTLSSTNTPPSRGSATFLTTAFVNGQATTLTSQAQRTSAANSNPDAFGGGGSPFEVGPNGNGGQKAGADFWLLLSVVFGVVLMRRW